MLIIELILTYASVNTKEQRLVTRPWMHNHISEKATEEDILMPSKT